MIQRLFTGFAMIALIFTISCKKDDNNSTSVRDYAEVAEEDDAEIIEYLKTHFYNYTDFENPPSDFDYKVVLDTISGLNAGKTPLFDQVKTMELNVVKSDNTKVLHKMYYLSVQEGSGTRATVADSVYVAYKGMTLAGTVFDNNEILTSSNWMDLIGNVVTSNPAGVIKGFREGIAQMKDSGSEPTVNSDGTFSAPNDSGMAILFIPSGLGYFSTSLTSISAYSPLIFVTKLIKTKKADHDKDGIPSINEIEHDEYGVITYTDCDGDRYPDYLDADKCD